MSDEQLAECRAQGALDNFLRGMKRELDLRDRSPEYRNNFWRAMHNALRDTYTEEYE